MSLCVCLYQGLCICGKEGCEERRDMNTGTELPARVVSNSLFDSACRSSLDFRNTFICIGRILGLLKYLHSVKIFCVSLEKPAEDLGAGKNSRLWLSFDWVAKTCVARNVSNVGRSKHSSEEIQIHWIA